MSVLYSTVSTLEPFLFSAHKLLDIYQEKEGGKQSHTYPYFYSSTNNSWE